MNNRLRELMVIYKKADELRVKAKRDYAAASTPEEMTKALKRLHQMEQEVQGVLVQLEKLDIK